MQKCVSGIGKMKKSKRILAILKAPADYTLGLVKNIYNPMQIDYVFMKGVSLAGETRVSREIDAMSIFKRIGWVFSVLKKYNAFNLNGYTGLTCILFIALNILFFHKPFTIDSDTELRVPRFFIKRILKRIWLSFVFGRYYCYGFSGGSYGHKELFRYYGMSEDRIFLAPMLVDNSMFSPKEEQKDACLGLVM